MRYRPDKHNLPVFTGGGILPVDKPAGWTSFDVVNFVRSRFNVPKVGHCGTLDPAATGLLVLLLGKFTGLSQALSGHDKVYRGRLRLGTETDSGDSEGKITAENPQAAAEITETALRKSAEEFTGEQEQLPPMVSAIKIHGKKLYELARKGIEIEREPRRITINSLVIDAIEPPCCDFTLGCSKGTYVRVLCQDWGRKLGCGGMLDALRRISSGGIGIDDALSTEQLKLMTQNELAAALEQYNRKYAGIIAEAKQL